MATEEKREERLRLLEDHIGRALDQSHASGELKNAAAYGKPLNFGDGYDETPAELRMGFKILKDAGVFPPEIELMRQIEAQRQLLESCTDASAAIALRQRLSELQQQLSLRLERLRASGSL